MNKNQGLRGWHAFCLSIPIGIAFSFLVVAISVGSITEGFAFMVLSIVCTAGISLAVWIPVWWGTGFFVMWLFGKISGAQILGTSEGSRSRQTQSAITNYMEKAKKRGLDEAEIFKRLRDAGWQDADIKHAAKLLKT